VLEYALLFSHTNNAAQGDYVKDDHDDEEYYTGANVAARCWRVRNRSTWLVETDKSLNACVVDDFGTLVQRRNAQLPD